MRLAMLFVSTMTTLHLSTGSAQNGEQVLRPEPPSKTRGQTPWIEHYRTRYALSDASAKLVGNTGLGFEPLYGVRNFREVLTGVLYRGGANNYYHRTNKRDNRNPLPTDGLQNLCQEGFGKAVYLYSTNFKSAPASLRCASVRAPNSEIEYEQISPYNESALKAIFTLILNAIETPESGPVYLHCWNGWHASGLAAALALRQFCGVSGEDAVAYWDKNTDGNNKDNAYKKIRQQIRDFVPFPEFHLSVDWQKRICSQL